MGQSSSDFPGFMWLLKPMHCRYTTPAMSAFKNKSYNPLRAPLVLSKERLTFLQGLNPVGVRNARVEAANLPSPTKERRRKRRSKSSTAMRNNGSESAQSRHSKASQHSMMSQMLDQNNEMRASLRELRGQLSHTHSQLDALQAAADETPRSRIFGGVYGAHNSARRNKWVPV